MQRCYTVAGPGEQGPVLSPVGEAELVRLEPRKTSTATHTPELKDLFSAPICPTRCNVCRVINNEAEVTVPGRP